MSSKRGSLQHPYKHEQGYNKSHNNEILLDDVVNIQLARGHVMLSNL
jgi:hypothetical protein